MLAIVMKAGDNNDGNSQLGNFDCQLLSNWLPRPNLSGSLHIECNPIYTTEVKYNSYSIMRQKRYKYKKKQIYKYKIKFKCPKPPIKGIAGFH